MSSTLASVAASRKSSPSSTSKTFLPIAFDLSMEAESTSSTGARPPRNPRPNCSASKNMILSSVAKLRPYDPSKGGLGKQSSLQQRLERAAPRNRRGGSAMILSTEKVKQQFLTDQLLHSFRPEFRASQPAHQDNCDICPLFISHQWLGLESS